MRQGRGGLSQQGSLSRLRSGSLLFVAGLWGAAELVEARTAWALQAESAPGATGPGESADTSSQSPGTGQAPGAKKGESTQAQGPVVTPPRLLEFVEAPYPPEAQAQGLTAEVVLGLLIQKDGSVGSVEVLQGAGNGFDEAAAEAGRQFRFEPALRDGEPVAVKIAFRYSFTLDEEPEPEPEPTVGELEGSVVVAGAEVPLGGARVAVVSPAGETFETRADAEGAWRFGDLPPGLYEVRVEAPGFAPVALEEAVAAGQATSLIYRMSPTSTGLEVRVVGKRPPREVTRRTISRREMSYVPGTRGDALRSLQSLPGLARPPGLAGLLIVRGAAPQDSAVFIDGDTVPLIYHFGGLSSAVPTELLDRIDFYPGNFSTKYGRVMGGIVDVALRSPDTSCPESPESPAPEGCYHGVASLDLLEARFVLQGPVPFLKDWSFALGARRSWVDAWLGPVLEETGAAVTSAPVYSDLQFILETNPTPNSRLSFRYLRSDDGLELVLNDPSAQDPGALGGSLRFGTAFRRFQMLFEAQLSDEVGVKTLVTTGPDQINFNLGRFEFNVDSLFVQARNEFAWNPSRWLTLNAGLDFVVVPFDVLVRLPEPPRPGEPASGPTSLRPLLESRNKSTAYRPGWYADAELRLARGLTIVPGFRVDYARDSADADFAPRANARYEWIDGDDATGTRRTTLKGGIGVYYQPPQFQETDSIFGTPGTQNNRAVHYSLGFERQLTEQVELSVEGFFKDLSNLVAREPGLQGSFDYNNRGTGSVRGGEMLLKYNADERFFGWLAYTLSRSTRQDGPGREQYLFQFDQTHILTALGSYRFGNGWEVGARLRVVSGSLDTPARTPPELPAVFAADAAAYTPLSAAPFSERLPLFHQLDLRAEKQWDFGSYRVAAFLDVWNSYNNAAKESISYNFDYSRRSYQEGLPIIPSLGMRGEF